MAILLTIIRTDRLNLSDAVRTSLLLLWLVATSVEIGGLGLWAFRRWRCEKYPTSAGETLLTINGLKFVVRAPCFLLEANRTYTDSWEHVINAVLVALIPGMLSLLAARRVTPTYWKGTIGINGLVLIGFGAMYAVYGDRIMDSVAPWLCVGWAVLLAGAAFIDWRIHQKLAWTHWLGVGAALATSTAIATIGIYNRFAPP